MHVLFLIDLLLKDSDPFSLNVSQTLLFTFLTAKWNPGLWILFQFIEYSSSVWLLLVIYSKSHCLVKYYFSVKVLNNCVAHFSPSSQYKVKQPTNPFSSAFSLDFSIITCLAGEFVQTMYIHQHSPNWSDVYSFGLPWFPIYSNKNFKTLWYNVKHG